MKGIVVAAGRGLRLRPLTESLPKCMLPVAGRPLLHHTIDRMRAAGCKDIVVVVGHEAEKIDADGALLVANRDYATNNILHSLMCARDHLEGPVICSYSDIWVEPEIYGTLTATPGEFVIAVDRDWMPYYEGRTDHPLEEAENVFYDSSGAVRAIGKHLGSSGIDGLACGEFLGLWRLGPGGSALLRDTFERIDAELDPEAPFQQAPHWRMAYVTDMIQELVDRGNRIDCALIERGWAELDTVQDYRRVADIADRQRLWTLLRNSMEP